MIDKTYILGISAFYHDSAAVLICNGEIIAAAQEERFSRIKHDSDFPIQSIKSILEIAKIDVSKIKHIAFYDKPFLKFERLLETYHAFAPVGFLSFSRMLPVWLNEKLFIKSTIKKQLRKICLKEFTLYFPEHHLSHAASAYYPSGFTDAAIVTADSVGEWTTSSIMHGKENCIKILREQHFPNSLGLLYSAFTYYCGFKVNSGEYKLMGLAPYAGENNVLVEEYKDRILRNILTLHADGSVLLNMNYFRFATGLRMTNNRKWNELFGIGPRHPESDITNEYIALAKAAQDITNEVMIRICKTAKELTGSKNLVMAGGVALNCVANNKIKEEKIFENIWIQPAAGDAGGALGAALAVHHITFNKPQNKCTTFDQMSGALLGPSFTNLQIKDCLNKYNAKFSFFENDDLLIETIATFLSENKVVGWFHGPMEFGPRALGSRSILASPLNIEMLQTLNLKIKFREGFRPFAPVVAEEDVENYFKDASISPYMLFTASVKNDIRTAFTSENIKLSLNEKINQQRSNLPAITHADYSARIQTLNKEMQPLLHKLLMAFKIKTGYSVLINTSFNVRGEPIVCTPDDAYLCFMKTGMDVLVMGKVIVLKKQE